MSTPITEPTQPAAPATPAEPTTPPAAPAQETPPPAQETDWKAEARKWEKLAKDNSHAATKLAEIEDAAKTELQKATDRAEAAEKAALVAKREAFAATKGVPASMVTGSTPEEWEAAATAALEWKGKPAEQPVTPPVTPTVHAAGNNGAPAGSPGDIDAQIADAEKSRNFKLAIALKQHKAAAQKTT